MTADIDDLLGGAPVRSELEPLPVDLPDTGARQRQNILKAASAGNGTFVQASQLMQPVTRAFLTEVTRLDENVVRRRLTHCPRLGKNGQRDLYDFMTAVAYLVDPKVDIEQYIKTVNPKNLPTQLNKDYWDARSRRLKYLLAAGEAWHTEDVVEVFGTVFMTIKDRLQLITETMRDRAKLTDEQAKRFSEMIDGLQDDLYTAMVTMPKDRQTSPVAMDDIDAVDV